MLAATIGRTFTFPLLAAASNQDADAVVRALDELWECRVVREQDPTTYDFNHDKIRDALYEGLSPARRANLHRKIATALEALHKEDTAKIAGQLAWHFQQAGQPTRTVEYWLQAGDAARELSGYTDARAHYRQALSLLADLPDTPEHLRQEFRAQMALGPVLIATEGVAAPEVERVYTRARELCRHIVVRQKPSGRKT